MVTVVAMVVWVSVAEADEEAAGGLQTTSTAAVAAAATMALPILCWWSVLQPKRTRPRRGPDAAEAFRQELMVRRSIVYVLLFFL